MPNRCGVTAYVTVVDAQPKASVTNNVSALGHALCEERAR